MSAIGAFLGPDASESLLRRVMRAQGSRGDDRSDLLVGEGAAIGVSRFGWETSETHAGPAVVGRRGSLRAVVDGSIYHRAELLGGLQRAGAHPTDTSVTSLVLAAYEAWGGELAAHLEGDYAFLIWDSLNSRLVAGRDYVGKRPLFARRIGRDTWGFASTSVALAEVPPGTPLQTLLLAAATGGMMGGSTGSAFVGVDPVPAGSVVAFSGADREDLWRWRPPAFRSRGDLPTAGEFGRLREAIMRAVAARAVTPATAVWLSGGMDSTSVFATGCHATRVAVGGGPAYVPISISYPEGDMAREDHHTAALAQQWGSDVHWLDCERIPLLQDFNVRSRERDDPYVHAFEPYNRVLSGAARELGLTVSLDGHGGDFLFHVSDSYFPELLMTGQWRRMAALFRELGLPPIRHFLRQFVLPALPEPALKLLESMRGTPLPRHLQMHPTAWVTERAKEMLYGAGAHVSGISRRWHEAPAAFDVRWYLTSPFMPRSAAWIHTFAMLAGSEVRSPLLDQRVMDLAADVPLEGRFSLNDQKPLLKKAMGELMPASLLAPRPQKTGVPTGYFRRRMLEEFGGLVSELLGGTGGIVQMALGDLGIVEPAKFVAAWQDYRSRQDHLTGANLFLTMGVEAWLRHHPGVGTKGI